jgi:hypothetical protein
VKYWNDELNTTSPLSDSVNAIGDCANDAVAGFCVIERDIVKSF